MIDSFGKIEGNDCYFSLANMKTKADLSKVKVYLLRKKRNFHQFVGQLAAHKKGSAQHSAILFRVKHYFNELYICSAEAS